jgi:hypothetical protein
MFIWPLRLFSACFDLAGQRLNFHIGAMIGFFSIAWSAHLVYLAIPVSRGAITGEQGWHTPAAHSSTLGWIPKVATLTQGDLSLSQPVHLTVDPESSWDSSVHLAFNPSCGQYLSREWASICPESAAAEVLSKTDTEYCQALRGLSGSASCLAHTSASMGFNIEFYTGNWASYIGRMDKDNHIMGSAYAAGESSLTFFGGLKPDTMSLYLTDIAHHHLAVGVLFVLSAHLYSSLYKGLGHAITDLLRASGNSAMIIPLSKSLHLQLSLACAGLAGITSLTAGQQAYSLGVYPYLSYDYVTTLALYLHHQYIGSFLMVASLVHAGIFFVRDYTVISRELHHSWRKCCASLELLQREGGKKQDKYRSLSDSAVAKSSCFSRASGSCCAILRRWKSS